MRPPARLVVWECRLCGYLWVRGSDQPAPWSGTRGRHQDVDGDRCDGKPATLGGVRAGAVLAAYSVGGMEAVEAMVERPSTPRGR